MASIALVPGEMRRLDVGPGERFAFRTLVGGQAVELIAHDAAAPKVRLSTLVTALAENVHRPQPGTRFWSQEYTPLFRLVEQTSDQHDMLLEACNPWLNAALFGAKDDRSCWSNFRAALEPMGLGEKWIPYPLGLFREAAETAGRYRLLQGTSRAEDQVAFVAETAIIVIASACPVSAPPLAGASPTVEIDWGAIYA